MYTYAYDIIMSMVIYIYNYIYNDTYMYISLCGLALLKAPSPSHIPFRNIPEYAVNLEVLNAQDKVRCNILDNRTGLKIVQIIPKLGMFLD